MKYFAIIFLTTGLMGLLPSFPALGQDKVAYQQRFLVGITGGATVSTGMYEYTNGPEPPRFNPMIFPGGGLTFDWRIARWLSLQNAFTYKAKGDRIDMKAWSEKLLDDLSSVWDTAFSITGDGTIKTDIRYLEWSVCPNIVIGNYVEAGIGGFLAVGLSGRETQNYTIDYYWEEAILETNTVQLEQPVEFVSLFQSDDITDALPVNRLDYGLLGRLGLRMGSFNLSASVSYSLNKWEPLKPGLFGYVEPKNNTRHLSGFLSLAFLFGGKD